jgi:hypothetical protein
VIVAKCVGLGLGARCSRIRVVVLYYFAAHIFFSCYLGEVFGSLFIRTCSASMLDVGYGKGRIGDRAMIGLNGMMFRCWVLSR